MKNSDGRHGGNHGSTDKGEAATAKAEASRNTDVDSLRGARDQNKVEGQTSGKE